MRAPMLLALVALLAPFVQAAAPPSVALTYDASVEPPRIEALLSPQDGAWSSLVEWPLPAGTLLRVEDDAGTPLASDVAPGGVLRVEPGNATRIRVVLGVDPLVVRGPGFREGAFRAEGEGYEVRPPPDAVVLDRLPLPEARVIFGDAAAAPPGPPVEPGADLVRILDVQGGRAWLTLWWNASRRNLAPGDDTIPSGWRETGREDLWGPLADHTQPWRAQARPSRLRLFLEPDAGPDAYPLAGIGVEARPRERAFLGANETRAAHLAVPTGVDGWSRAEGGPFVVYARDPETARFAARAGERAGPVLARVLEESGLPARDVIPVIVSPRGESGWARWAFLQPESFVRELRDGDQAWDEAAILVHEGFHGSQLDAAPWLDLPWWMEGSASETDRHLPAEAYCEGSAARDCFDPPTLEGADLARFGRERFPFSWRQPDPTLSADETGYRYAASRHIVASYRDRAGEGAWRDVWRAIGADPSCCDHAALMEILLEAAPNLTAADIEQARGPPTPGATMPAPSTVISAPTPTDGEVAEPSGAADAPTPFLSPAMLIAAAALAARALGRRGR